MLMAKGGHKKVNSFKVRGVFRLLNDIYVNVWYVRVVGMCADVFGF